MIIESMKPSSDQLQKKNVYVVKMETTGLDPDDEILELCVIDARNPYKQTPSGREVVPLFHSRFRPEYKSEWPKAQRKHGISPEMVAKARFLSDYQNQLVPLFMHCDCLVCFNADFDFSVLRRFFMFRTPLMTIDIMRDWTDIIAKPSDPTEPRVNIPFQSQRELFTHFNWPLGKGLLSDCVGLRHCFLQLIPTGGLHIRRPLLERRFARSTAIQLKAVEDNFASELSAMRIGPTLSMEETENGELRVRIGVNDPEHVLLDTDFPEIVLDLDPTGSAGEVRKRVARAVQEQKTLTQGLRKFLTDIILGLRPKEEEEGFLSHLPGCKAARWNPYFTDIVPADGGKPVGLQKTLERWGIRQEESMAFGDGGNDIDMLRYAGVGVAMGNASDDVKLAADYVTADVDDDGVRRALEHYGVI